MSYTSCKKSWPSRRGPFKAKNNDELIDLKQVIDSVKTAQIIEALKLSGTVDEAAERMSVKRTTLNSSMKKLNIDTKKYLKEKRTQT